MTTLTPGHYPNLPAEEYFRIEAASNSGLKQVGISLAHYLEWRKSDDRPSDPMRMGTAAHTLLLEGGAAFESRFAIEPKKPGETFLTSAGKPSRSYRSTSSFKDWEAERLAEGREILSFEDAANVREMCLRVRENPYASQLLDAAERKEHTIIWTDEEFDVPCKLRFDAVVELDERHSVSGTYGLDLKSTYSGNARPHEFARHAARMGYGIQARHYTRGWEAVEGRAPDGWLTIVVERDPPFGVMVYLYDGEWIWNAEQRYRDALQTYAEWWHEGRPDDVPCYPESIELLKCPRWA